MNYNDIIYFTLYFTLEQGEAKIAAMAKSDSPLRATPPEEVPLPNAPLVRVIAQARFPLVVAIEQRDFMAPFQEAIRDRYPVLRQEQMQGVLLGPAGLMPQAPQIAWRFSDATNTWRVSLAPDFLALETTSYSSRDDFMGRFREAITALATHVSPKLIDRLGVRYVDRIVGDSVKDIVTLVKPEVRGILGTSLAADAVHSVCESMLTLDDARMVARWGSLPAGATMDPAIEPANEPSWILDLDMFTAASMPFSVDRTVADAARFAERIYTFFRWSVTDEFLRRYGGKV